MRVKILAFALLMTLLSGCTLFRAFKPTEIVKHPDAEMLIQEAKGKYLRVAVYDAQNNQLIEYGWIRVEDSALKGWTLHKYDWEALIRKRVGQ